MIKYFVFVFYPLLFFTGQDLRGKWTNILETTETEDYFILEDKDNNSYSGISFDSNSEDSYCYYTFLLKKDPNSDYCLAKDDQLIKKSPDHGPVAFKLYYSIEGEDEYLTGQGFLIEPFGLSAPFPVKYHKISPEFKNESKKPEIREEAPKKENTIPPVKENPPLKQNPPKEIPKQNPVSPKFSEKEKEDMIKLKSTRKNERKALINVNSKTIKLNVYDYGKEDHDSISIFLNNELIAYKIPINNIKKEFSLQIAPEKVNDLTFVANNLGEIPPNTTQIEILADDKVFNYTLFTNLEKNVVIQLRFFKNSP